MGKKEAEIDCLKIVKRCLPIGNYAKTINEIFSKNFVETERPDFLFAGEVGLEHFLVDVIYKENSKTGKALSIERTNKSNALKKIELYKDKELLDNDIENGRVPKFLEDFMNTEIAGVNHFSYQKFFKNFKDIFDNHYARVDEYRSQCKTLGFMIEMPYPIVSGKQRYIIYNNGKCRSQMLNVPPVPKDVINYFRRHKKIDFIVLVFRPIHMSAQKQDKYYRVFYLDINNIDRCLREQHVFLCDKFDYEIKFANDDVIKLNVKENE